MTCWNKEQLENMLEDVINELDLSDGMIEQHGPLGTPPAELVRLVLERKDQEISMLRRGFVDVSRISVERTQPRRIVFEEITIDEYYQLFNDGKQVFAMCGGYWHEVKEGKS